MSEPKPNLTLPHWLGGCVLALLVFQSGLLWMQGVMLQRQHEDLLGLREDIQSMADSLEQGDGGWESEDAGPSPARSQGPRRRPGSVKVLFLQAEVDEQAAARKELEAAKQSATEAVAKARDTQAKLSISENIRKADEKAKLEAEGRKTRPWLWAGAGLALVAMMARAWLRKRG